MDYVNADNEAAGKKLEPSGQIFYRPAPSVKKNKAFSKNRVFPLFFRENT